MTTVGVRGPLSLRVIARSIVLTLLVGIGIGAIVVMVMISILSQPQPQSIVETEPIILNNVTLVVIDSQTNKALTGYQLSLRTVPMIYNNSRMIANYSGIQYVIVEKPGYNPVQSLIRENMTNIITLTKFPPPGQRFSYVQNLINDAILNILRGQDSVYSIVNYSRLELNSTSVQAWNVTAFNPDRTSLISASYVEADLVNHVIYIENLRLKNLSNDIILGNEMFFERLTLRELYDTDI